MYRTIIDVSVQQKLKRVIIEYDNGEQLTLRFDELYPQVSPSAQIISLTLPSPQTLVFNFDDGTHVPFPPKNSH